MFAQLAEAPQRRHIAARRGMSSVYLLFALTFVLFGLVSFAVDLGRVRVGKAQLQTATDAASHAAVWALPMHDFSGAADRAYDVAGANHCDGVAVALQSGDIVFGKYYRPTRTFYPVGTPDWDDETVYIEESNAIRVTGVRHTSRNNPINLSFGPIIGLNTFNLEAPATAYIFGGPVGPGGADGFGIVGIDGVGGNGNRARVDSYLPFAGPYSTSTARHNGNVASNGDITLTNSDIYGDARPGPGGHVTEWPNTSVTGWQGPLDAPLSFPPVTVPGGLPTLPNGTVPGGSTPGARISYTINGNLNDLVTSGYVRVYVNGNVSGNINSTDRIPEKIELYVVGNRNITLNGNRQMYAHLYAPGATFSTNGTPDFFGWIIAKSINFGGNPGIHYDESTVSYPGQPPNPPFKASLVK
ncbi:MAG: DUF7305 domain-containing protein [Tepidisphaeraceae bacterium]